MVLYTGPWGPVTTETIAIFGTVQTRRERLFLRAGQVCLASYLEGGRGPCSRCKGNYGMEKLDL